MKNSQINKKIAVGLSAIAAWSCLAPVGLAQAVDLSPSGYECSYQTFPVRSINQSCDQGIQHILITFMQYRYGQVVGVWDDFGDGPGVSMVHLVSTEAVGISEYWTRVFH